MMVQLEYLSATEGGNWSSMRIFTLLEPTLLKVISVWMEIGKQNYIQKQRLPQCISSSFWPFFVDIVVSCHLLLYKDQFVIILPVLELPLLSRLMTPAW